MTADILRRKKTSWLCDLNLRQTCAVDFSSGTGVWIYLFRLGTGKYFLCIAEVSECGHNSTLRRKATLLGRFGLPMNDDRKTHIELLKLIGE